MTVAELLNVTYSSFHTQEACILYCATNILRGHIQTLKGNYSSYSS